MMMMMMIIIIITIIIMFICGHELVADSLQVRPLGPISLLMFIYIYVYINNITQQLLELCVESNLASTFVLSSNHKL